MSKIKIETLTPVHIGSGNLLYNNSDFVHEQIDEDAYLVVISEDKIGKLLGNKGEDFIDLWLTTIANKGDIREFIKIFSSAAIVDDYAKRKILSFSKVNPNDTLKEIIHNGMGLPYIPGSSIKGAIRTAILASLVKNINNIEDKIVIKQRDRDGYLVPRKDKQGNIMTDAKAVEKSLFGNDPNSDAFRFIQVGDAYFEAESEIATRLVNLNITTLDDLMDTKKSQLVEAIGQEAESEFQLKIAKEYYDFAKPKFNELGKLPVTNISDLFNLINTHTKQLVEDEIEYWNNIEKTGGNGYVEEMEKISQAINTCKSGKSCVLRIGHASGWRFITGAWTEKLSNFKDVVVPASRPRNNSYVEYDFPKTRRLDEESYILGFVRLTIK